MSSNPNRIKSWVIQTGFNHSSHWCDRICEKGFKSRINNSKRKTLRTHRTGK